MSNRLDRQAGQSLKLSPRLQRALVDGAARIDFLCFLRLAFECIEPGKTLHLNWHIQAMAHRLERVRLGQSRRLIFTMPPRYLKSIVASVIWPAYLLGLDPTLRII